MDLEWIGISPSSAAPFLGNIFTVLSTVSGHEDAGATTEYLAGLDDF
jgi:hypothetical protein